MANQKGNDFNDFFSLLDKASIFTSNRPCKQDFPFVNEGNKKKQDRKAKTSKVNNIEDGFITQEEREYAKAIGFDLSESDNENDYGSQTGNSNDITIENNLSKMYLNQPSNKCNHAVTNLPKKNGYGIGRGRLISAAADCENKYPLRRRQELNDKVISEQLREVIGGGASNELIEDGFAKLFSKKNSNEPLSSVLEKNNINEESSPEKKNINKESSASNSGDRKSELKYIELHTPPHSPDNELENLQSAASSNSCEILNGSGQSGEIFKPESPTDFGVSKVPCIYEDGLSYFNSIDIEQQTLNSDNSNCINSNGDIKIIDEYPKFRFKTRDEEKSYKKLCGFGRNALLNGLLKNNCELNEPVDKKYAMPDHSRNNVSHINMKKVNGDCSQPTQEEANSVSSDKLVHDDNDFTDFYKLNCKISPVNSSEFSSNDNSLVNSSPHKTKTFAKLVYEREKKERKNRTFTFGDYLPPDTLNNINSGGFSHLNPGAAAFVPSLCTEKRSSGNFILNETNFPPLS